MEKILLIITDWNLRQLYHEQILSKSIEVVPIDTYSNGLVILLLMQFAKVVVYVDETSASQAEVFLSIRRKHQKLLAIPVILLGDKDAYTHFLTDRDVALDPLVFSPGEIIQHIQGVVR